MGQLSFKSAFFAALLISLAAPLSAFAQSDYQDTFGDEDDNPVPPPPAQNQIVDPSTVSLFGSGSGMFPGAQRKLPSPDAWSDLNKLPSDERIEDTYEMKMREENSKPLPDHKPFGDRWDYLKSRTEKKKSPF
jgi:hypothetical protein